MSAAVIERLKARAGTLRMDILALYYAGKDPRTPWVAKALVFFVLAHTLSPLDLIPDFIPVLGYLDDLILTPGGLWLAVKMIPPQVLAEARAKAAAGSMGEGLARLGMVSTLVLWLLAAAMITILILYFTNGL